MLKAVLTAADVEFEERDGGRLGTPPPDADWHDMAGLAQFWMQDATFPVLTVEPSDAALGI